MSDINHLDVERITAVRRTALPPNPYAGGYGPKIPTSVIVQVDGKGPWRRVYNMLYANAGSIYVLLKGTEWFVSDTHLLVLLESKVCQFCGDMITRDGVLTDRVWVDRTGGDGCSGRLCVVTDPNLTHDPERIQAPGQKDCGCFWACTHDNQ